MIICIAFEVLLQIGITYCFRVNEAFGAQRIGRLLESLTGKDEFRKVRSWVKTCSGQKYDPHRIMRPVQATQSPRHSGAAPEVALRPEDASFQGAPMLLTISELPPSGDFSSAQNNHDNRSSLISAFSYTTATDHPDLR